MSRIGGEQEVEAINMSRKGDAAADSQAEAEVSRKERERN